MPEQIKHKLPQTPEYLEPYIPLMENAVSELFEGDSTYSLVDLVKLATDKNIIIGDSEGLNLPKKAVIKIPASENRPEGKYFDLAPVRKAYEQLSNDVSIHDIVVFVSEYPFESDVYDEDLIKLILEKYSSPIKTK